METAYAKLHYVVPELEHGYGNNVHLLSDVVLLSELAELSQKTTPVARCNRLVRDIYQGMLRYVLAAEFPRTHADVRTRMFDHTPRGVFSGELIDRDTDAVTVALARAGTLPSQVCFEFLGELLAPDRVRQDHVYLNRKTNDAGEVIGTNYSGSKIGGGIKNAMVLVPDPMAATGGSDADDHRSAVQEGCRWSGAPLRGDALDRDPGILGAHAQAPRRRGDLQRASRSRNVGRSGVAKATR